MNPPRKYNESGLQAAHHTWFHNTHPELRGLGFMIHNDGVKNPVQASRDKGRGLVAGIPDWCLMVPRGPWHGLFLEFKVGPNGLDPVQRKRIGQLRQQGYRVEVVRDLLTSQTLLTEYLSA